MRIETARRVYHGAAVRDSGKVAQHHAKTMVKRHGDADHIVRRVVHGLPYEEGIVEDAAVSERRRFRMPSRSARKLDVDRLRRQLRRLRTLATPVQRIERDGTRHFLALASHNDMPQRWHPSASVAGALSGHSRKLRAKLLDHVRMVCESCRWHHRKGLAANQVERVF